ncbi:hypothetical protein QCA50_008990 [Cerrena zonata]|uniref:Glycopeptide n=1 Tax=Cerrena zonata TaxID=2478898 RepID=A0AAW0G3B9_9APHY
MVTSKRLTATLGFFSTAAYVYAESHTVVFVNDCGFGTPLLKAQDGTTLSTGGTFTINGPLIGAIAFLQTGSCSDKGEGCTIVEITLQNPTTPGNGSSVDINFLPPDHTFSGPTGFGYFNGCDGAGADCTTPNCPTPFPHQGPLEVDCDADNVNLAVTFCD